MYPVQLMFMIGCAGAGKGYLGKVLTERINNLIIISTGELCRKHKESQTDLYLTAQEYMDRNRISFWPDHCLYQVLEEELSVTLSPCGLVLVDGFPRTTPQMNWILGNKSLPSYKFLVVETPEELCLSRMKDRGREDDSKNGHKGRLKRVKDFNKHTVPTIGLIPPEQLIRFNGLNPSDEDFLKVVKTLTN